MMRLITWLFWLTTRGDVVAEAELAKVEHATW
jgi:hypothetical protein